MRCNSVLQSGDVLLEHYEVHRESLADMAFEQVNYRPTYDDTVRPNTNSTVVEFHYTKSLTLRSNLPIKTSAS